MNAKKIGLVNYYYSNNNYGAVLQAYALQEILTGMGHNVEIIDFRNSPRRPDKFLREVKLINSPNNSFEQFRKKYLKLSKQRYYWPIQLQLAKFNYDVVIVGSDQMWRADFNISKSIVAPHTIFYLSFLPCNIKRLAYAISFGVDFWNTGRFKKYHNKVISEVQKFYAVSVREKQGIKICADNFGLNVPLVLDPTLLVDKSVFENIVSSVEQYSSLNHIVYYQLDNSNKEFAKSLQHLSEQLNIKTKDIYRKSIKETINEFEYFTVEEWLEGIKNSALVVTDSFHCVCFSIIFRKPFIFFANINKGLSRIESLLSIFEISNRIYTSFDNIVSDKRWEEPIEYSLVDKKLETLKSVSKNFFLESL